VTILQSAPARLAMRAYQKGRLVRGRLGGAPEWRGVRILGYHRISASRDLLAVRPDAFRAQLEEALSAGLEPIPLTRALDLLERPVEGRYLCVTFDDGYRDNLELAEPILRELRVPATIFVPSQVIHGNAGYWWYDAPPPALTWDEARELVAGGLVDVQAHTRTHPRLPALDEERAREEIGGCKDEIEAEVGYQVTSFAYPAGLYTERDARLVAEAGYRAGLTTDPGVNPGGLPMTTLARTLVFWEDSLVDFRGKLAGLLDRPPRLREWLYRRLRTAG